VSDQNIKVGVVGWPISHSRSPLIHNYWIKTMGLSGHYEAIAVEPQYFERDIRGLMAAGFAGVNVTVPHKHAALAMADTISPQAQRIGAANTLVFPGDGTISAHNTDATGFMENLRAGASDIEFVGKTALVLGAGGAARAIICGLQDAGVANIILANRTADRATALQQAFGEAGPIDVLPWDGRHDALETVDLLVNTTSLGMVGSPPLALDLSALKKTAVVTDIVYAPLETSLLADARARGHVAVDGLGMLLHQAAPAFAAWFGVMPSVDAALRQLIIDDLEKST
jgi:shikimate dehydrogenase